MKTSRALNENCGLTQIKYFHNISKVIHFYSIVDEDGNSYIVEVWFEDCRDEILYCDSLEEMELVISKLSMLKGIMIEDEKGNVTFNN